MNEMINKTFPNMPIHHSDLYVADYTQQTNSERGVEISEVAFADIESCHFKNPNKIKFASINNEKHRNVFSSDDGKSVTQCDYMAVSLNAKKKGWICLVEFKYCMEKNVVDNAIGAYSQIRKTFDFLVSKSILNLDTHRIYFNVSIPDHSHKEPFSSFVFSQDEIIETKRKDKIHLLGYNELTIYNEGRLYFPNS